MVAVNETSMPGSEASRRRTWPLPRNLYQGMALDAVTGLYDDRVRDYPPSLGRWMEQDPAQVINGANTYQFVDSSPVGLVDLGVTEVKRYRITIIKASFPYTWSFTPAGQTWLDLYVKATRDSPPTVFKKVLISQTTDYQSDAGGRTNKLVVVVSIDKITSHKVGQSKTYTFRVKIRAYVKVTWWLLHAPRTWTRLAARSSSGRRLPSDAIAKGVEID